MSAIKGKTPPPSVWLCEDCADVIPQFNTYGVKCERQPKLCQRCNGTGCHVTVYLPHAHRCAGPCVTEAGLCQFHATERERLMAGAL